MRNPDALHAGPSTVNRPLCSPAVLSPEEIGSSGPGVAPNGTPSNTSINIEVDPRRECRDLVATGDRPAADDDEADECPAPCDT
jgi:hypothetical protein